MDLSLPKEKCYFKKIIKENRRTVFLLKVSPSDLSVKIKGVRREKLQFYLGSHNQVLFHSQSYGSRFVDQTTLTFLWKLCDSTSWYCYDQIMPITCLWLNGDDHAYVIEFSAFIITWKSIFSIFCNLFLMAIIG